MFEKRSLIFVSATFLCTSIIIGSGFSLWIFNEDFIKVKEIDYYGDYNFNRKTKITLHKKIELTY